MTRATSLTAARCETLAGLPGQGTRTAGRSRDWSFSAPLSDRVESRPLRDHERMAGFAIDAPNQPFRYRSTLP